MKTITLCFACVGLTFLTACQSTDKAPMAKNAEVNQQTQYFVEAKVALDKLKSDIKQGRKDELNYFAPGTFKQAVAEFDNATEEYTDIGKNGASSLNVFQSDTEQYEEAKQEIINYIALANQKLKFAYSIKESAESTLSESFAQRRLLKEIGAHTLYNKDYKELSDRLDELVEDIDEGKVSAAQEKQPKLLLDMQTLEVRTVRYNALGQLDKDIAFIKKKRLAKSVPISHQQLIKARNSANMILTANPRAAAEINTAVELAEFQLAHLYHISKEVNELKKVKSKSFESYILDKETQLFTISDSLGTADVRDLAMAKQVEAIALQASSMKGKLTTANAAVLALQSDSTQSSEATESLRTEFKSQLVNLNEKYDALVIENSELNKAMQSQNIELVRLEAYKEAVLQIEGKHAAEKALALEAQAKKEAEQKVLAALALEAQAKKEAEQKVLAALAIEAQAKQEAEQKVLAALAIEAQAKQEAEQVALAAQEKTAVQPVAVSQTVEPVVATEAKLEVSEEVLKVNAVKDVVETETIDKN